MWQNSLYGFLIFQQSKNQKYFWKSVIHSHSYFAVWTNPFQSWGSACTVMLRSKHVCLSPTLRKHVKGLHGHKSKHKKAKSKWLALLPANDLIENERLLVCFQFILFSVASVLRIADSFSNDRDCLTNIESVTCEASWNYCFNMKVFVRKSSGEEILYLDKQCIPYFVFNQPDPNIVCDLKNTTFTSQGHTMDNCTSRCCTGTHPMSLTLIY